VSPTPFNPVDNNNAPGANPGEEGDLEAIVSSLEGGVELVEKNKQLFGRAKNAEEENKQLKAKLAQLEKQRPAAGSGGAGETPSRELELVNLRLDGYSEEEAQFIMSNGGRSAKENQFVKAGIDALRAAKKQEESSVNASPAVTPKSPVFKKHTEAELKGMKTEDLEKLLKQSGL